MVRATYNLLKKATSTGKYKYYHLLSGADLPLKTQDEIHDFLLDCDKEFVHFNVDAPKECAEVKYYHLFEKDFRSRKFFKRVIRKVSLILQKMIGIDRCRKDTYEIMHGSAWFSITDDLARYVIKKEDFVMKRWRLSLFSDERFMQTIVNNSKFRNRLFVPVERQANDSFNCMRKIDWKRGWPYVWRDGDFDELMNSGCLFGRKFDPDVDSQIISRIEKALLG